MYELDSHGRNETPTVLSQDPSDCFAKNKMPGFPDTGKLVIPFHQNHLQTPKNCFL